GVNVAPLKKYGILKTTSGAILHCFLQVPEDAAAGVFQPEPAQQLNMILPWPITDPQFAQLPVVVIEPIEIIDVAQKPEEKKWDFNNDGVPSISDVLWFLSELNSLSEYSAALDWNDDGVCDAADAVVLYQVIRDNTVSSVMLAAALESTAPGAELAKWSTEKKGAVLEMVKQMNLAQADEAALCSLLKVTKKKKPRLSRKYLIQK
ncbi:MAG: hypothetical protein U9N45_08300, partial [Gemmatimonadota bacterium]|nr:hypothetical protein [Gemmatimonadota bacterium]